MMFSFNNPYILFLIPAAVLFIFLTSRKLNRLAVWKRRMVTGLRIAILILLFAALADMGLKHTSDSSTTIFVVDSSDSMSKSKDTVEQFIKDALKNKKPSEKVGIVNFGANSAVELNPELRPSFSSMQTSINSNFTNIDQALKFASSLIPGGDRKRLVLVSDGRENAGSSIKQARLLKQQNIITDVFSVSNRQPGEVQIKEVRTPENLRLNDKFEININVDSTVKTGAVLKLYANRRLIAEKQIEIQNGENNYSFSDIAKTGGIVTYSATIEPDEDSIVKNNSMATFSYVRDIARILVIQDEDEAASELLKMLGKDVNIAVSKPENVPFTLDELQKYDAFIISNVSAERLDDRFLNNLEISIRNQGKGLLVTGGENSYAPGGYYKTPLEKVLPVNMEIKPKEELPNLGLVLVIDKSGSMSEGQYGISKVDLAKEAAIRSTEVLRKQDMVGVIAFDDAVQWVVKTQKLDSLSRVQDSIGTIRADGGTQIINPLMEAYKSLKDLKTKLKHIILLTDGQAEKAGYEEFMEGISKSGITLSTVAVGQSADISLLSALAEGGKGRFYMTDEFSDIPKIFAKETFLAGKTYLNNRTFTPSLSSYSELLSGIDAIPSLDGYVGSSAKSTAKVIFSSDKDDPVLAAWQYGLGRTIAWTSDAKGIWTSKWLRWSQSARFWKNLISWVIQKKQMDDYTLKGSMESGAASLELTLPPEEISPDEQVEAVISSPSGKEQATALNPLSPGTYKGGFNSDETGVYIANVNIKKGNTIVKSINSAISLPYSPEYDIARKDSSTTLERLAYEGGGKVIKDSRDVFSGSLPPVTSVVDMTNLFIILVIILFMLDIAVRRLNIDIGKAAAVITKYTTKGAAQVDMITGPALSKLYSIKIKVIKKRAVRASIGDKGKPENKQETSINSDESRSKPAVKPESKSTDAHVSLLLEKKKKRSR